MPEPEPNDQVVESGEAKVYVAEDTSPALEGQALDAQQTEEGVGFTLQPNGVRDLSVGRRPTGPAAAASPPRRPPCGSRARR